MNLPESLMNSLIGVKGFDKEGFERIHLSGEQVTSVRINPSKKSEIGNRKSKIPWTKYGYYLETRPSFTFDPLFHAGTYYVQEASSMFIEQALSQTMDLLKPLRILDLSAAPGGKSTHIQSLISAESMLVSNEVIRSRANVLKDNIIKWGSSNVVVTNNDPRDFARLKDFFDVVVVDAPCSGSGLFRRDPEAVEEWSLNNVQLCSQRQQRILADIWPVIKKGGLLIYSTCSYSKEEDEEILDWMGREFKVGDCRLEIDPDWNITEICSSSIHGYRFWPDKVKGEGFFIACLRKLDGEESQSFKTKLRPDKLTKKESAIMEKWVNTEGLEFVKYKDTIFAWPAPLVNDYSLLLSELKLIYSGTLVGELRHDKLIPDHALAMSKLVNHSIPATELNYEQAIEYLRKKDPLVQTKEKGWQLVKYNGYALGWINALPTRINNYYPKELRILKEA